jgi:hypothetical protein
MDQKLFCSDRLIIPHGHVVYLMKVLQSEYGIRNVDLDQYFSFQ